MQGMLSGANGLHEFERRSIMMHGPIGASPEFVDNAQVVMDFDGRAASARTLSQFQGCQQFPLSFIELSSPAGFHKA